MLSSFTKVIILHTKILGLFSALTLHCSALLLKIIDERKLDGRDTWKEWEWRSVRKWGSCTIKVGICLRVSVCRDDNRGQGVACSCCGPLTCWGKDEVASCLFLCTLTNPLCQFNIIHTVSFLSSVQFCGKGSTRADYLQFVLRSAPNVSYPH